jgi:hypothetical protein
LRQLRAEVTPDKPLSERRFMADVFLFFIESGSRRPNEAKQHLEAALASPKRRVDLLPMLYYRRALQALNRPLDYQRLKNLRGWEVESFPL